MGHPTPSPGGFVVDQALARRTVPGFYILRNDQAVVGPRGSLCPRPLLARCVAPRRADRWGGRQRAGAHRPLHQSRWRGLRRRRVHAQRRNASRHAARGGFPAERTGHRRVRRSVRRRGALAVDRRAALGQVLFRAVPSHRTNGRVRGDSRRLRRRQRVRRLRPLGVASNVAASVTSTRSTRRPTDEHGA